ncbi:zinc-binding dehydrogenase [Enemella sp. A6]|uniref:zinc-binding dehydrogenase n=1 Tax=Enemella sp. A6 TaxID=3440152 RepID=UPI003EB93C61
MRGTVLHGPGDIRLDERPDPSIHAPTDAIIEVLATCVCGSDMWWFRGVHRADKPRIIGHEAVGVVREVGSEVRTVRPGDFVITPFLWSDNTCAHCAAGITSSCANGGAFGVPDRHGHPVDGCQGEFIRIPLADGTLVAAPHPEDDAMLASMLGLSDVTTTGWHAAVSAGVAPGDTVVVVGDGAVGQSAVASAVAQGAERVIAMSKYPDRQALARELGATEVLESRGDQAVAEILDLTDGIGADAVLECVGTSESLNSALAMTRPGSKVGFVGIPHDAKPPLGLMFTHNVGLAGGMAPVRHYLPELVARVRDGWTAPGKVFDRVRPLSEVADAYADMDQRRATKVMLRP